MNSVSYEYELLKNFWQALETSIQGNNFTRQLKFKKLSEPIIIGENHFTSVRKHCLVTWVFQK